MAPLASNDEGGVRVAKVPLFNRHDKPITSVDDWETLASPGPGKWRTDYSAEALAQAWIAGRGPDGLLDLLAKQGGDRFEAVQLERATAEAQTHFDEFGGPRNHDLLIEASDSTGRLTIGLEGKVNETFGQTVREYRAAAEKKREANKPTNAPERLDSLLAALAGAERVSAPELADLRYQLFSATAGTLAAANDHEASRAVFVVHELQTAVADAAAQAENANSLADFVEVALGLPRPDGDEWLVGPSKAKAGSDRIPGDVELWVGRFTTS